MSGYDDLERRWECTDPEREAMEYEFNARYDRWDGWGDPDPAARDEGWDDPMPDVAPPAPPVVSPVVNVNDDEIPF